ncbi:MAG: S-layer homology domain-containing protein, partial [Candidatus Peribacteraceae bacterium]|nr:S-layer homology domain-containing protein [Candidatus Peribacteraceae bacterium]
MRRFALLGLSVLVPLAVGAQVTPFLDVVGHPHAAQVELLHARGVVEGIGYGLFRPDILLNRAEFLKILMRAVYGDTGTQTTDTACFTDFIGPSQWYWSLACAAKARGIITGYPDGTFRGQKNVILAEALKMSIDGWEMQTPSYLSGAANWYDPYIDVGASKRIFDYFPYDPGHLLTRSEMAVLLVSLGGNIATVGIEPPRSASSVSSVPSSVPSSSSQSSVTLPVCGNGKVETGEQCDDGNRVSGDGCSSQCAIDRELPAELLFASQEIPSEMREGGSKDVPLLTIDAAARNGDVLVTGLHVQVMTGSIARLRNFRIRFDADGDGMPEKMAGGAILTKDTLSFTALAIPVRAGTVVRIEIVADISLTVNPRAIGARIDPENQEAVRAISVRGFTDLTGIHLDDQPCPVAMCAVTLSVGSGATELPTTGPAAGTLTVMPDSIPVRSRQLLPGSADSVVARFKLHAGGEDVRVTSLAFSGASVIPYLELYQGSSAMPFASATASDCRNLSGGLLCAQTDFVVAQDRDVTLLIRAQIPVGNPRRLSGRSIAVTLLPSSRKQPAVEAIGVQSGVAFQLSDAPGKQEGKIFLGVLGAQQAVVGPRHDVAASRIVAIENADVNPDGSPVQLGPMMVGTFRFRASPGPGKITLDSFPPRLHTLVFTLTTQNVDIDPATITLVNPRTPSAAKVCTASEPGTSRTIAC